MDAIRHPGVKRCQECNDSAKTLYPFSCHQLYRVRAYLLSEPMEYRALSFREASL